MRHPRWKRANIRIASYEDEQVDGPRIQMVCVRRVTRGPVKRWIPIPDSWANTHVRDRGATAAPSLHNTFTDDVVLNEKQINLVLQRLSL